MWGISASTVEGRDRGRRRGGWCMIASVSRGGPVEQRRLAESQYKSAYTAVWRSAQVAEVRDVLDALARFQKAAVALSLTKPEPRGQGMWGSDEIVKGWRGRPSPQAEP